MSPGRPPQRIAVLAYEGCLGTEILAIADLLLIANRIAAANGERSGDLFEVCVVGREPVVTTAAGVPLHAQPLRVDIDALVVPGFDLGSPRHVDRSLANWTSEVAYIASVDAAHIPVASVCVGAFLLGEAGLLEGRQATTSWLFARQLAERYPSADVTADCMIVSDRTVTTTAAFSAVHDLAVRLVRLHAGDDLARLVARVALVADNRNNQAPYVDETLLGTEAGRFTREAKGWLVERLAEPYSLVALAEAFSVSPRTVLRRFEQEAGQSPLTFLQQARVNAAKRLLESPDHDVVSAMESVGYTDVASFRRLFVAHIGVTPAAYRRQFRTARQGHAPDSP
ncbi:GlxA family transcriptional regulator [Nitriliruptor alkaliphilus]|uniref:GlxA family transcriptional regulator n=1 Tax=Nitriliruptor alkaliphilus TaxID=427918 RepID=UPI000695DB90|nr:helix-turn-helix domain-containing protein [Nitriliruptor alkaliphilus]